jgi:hypothetical protein
MPYPRSYNVPTRMIQRDMCGWSILEITDLHCGLWTRWGGRLPHKIAHTRRCTCIASVQIARFWRCVLRRVVCRGATAEATAEATNTSSCRSGMTETWQFARPAPETAGRAIKRRGYGSRASLATALKRASPGASLRPSLIRLGEAWSTSYSFTLCASVLFPRPGFRFYQSLFISLLYPVFAQSFAVASHSFPLHYPIANHSSGAPRPPKLGASPPSPANTLCIS